MRSGRQPAGMNLALEAASDWGVEQEGVYAVEAAIEPFRWTNGAARIVTRVVEPPRALRVMLSSITRPHTPLTIAVGGCVVFEGELTGGVWDQTLALGRCAPGAETAIEIRSGTFTPRTGDDRTLGVPVVAVQFVK
jgi:hypothetical protein